MKPDKILQEAKQWFVCRWEGEPFEQRRLANSPQEAVKDHVWEAIRSRREFDVDLDRNVHVVGDAVRDYHGEERSFEVAVVVDITEVTAKPSKPAKSQLTLTGAS